MILEPRIKIGQQIQLISETNPQLTGLYKVIGVTHTGIISPVKSSDAITKLTLYYGEKPLRMV